MRNTTTSTTPKLMAIDPAGCRFNSDTPHYLSSAGDVVLRPGYESRTEIPVARFLRSNPSALSS